jgi:hypothetical protein
MQQNGHPGSENNSIAEDKMKKRALFHLPFAFLFALIAGIAAPAAYALEVGGVTLDESVRVANQDLTVNGAGIRHKLIFRVYVAGLYLAEKKSTPADILAAAGPKRVTMVMLRRVGSEELGRGFVSGVQQNLEVAERARLVNQMRRFGEIFASIPELNKGDVVTIDWVPDTGTVLHHNGKQISEPLPDVDFYNALLKIWIGDKPVDLRLKTALLNAPD